MARRYRIIQYDGDDAAIDALFLRSINGTYQPGTVKISAWEAKRGDVVEWRAGLPQWQPPANHAGDSRDDA